MQPENTIQVQTEFTPNPQSLKFNVNRALLEQGSLFFENASAAQGVSTLAQKLFAVPNVEQVLIGQNFVTITRRADLETWASIIPPVSKILQEHLSKGEPVVEKNAGAASQQGTSPTTEIEKKIVQILDAHVRPAIARDGGDIIFHGFNDGVVTLYLQGACSTCPSSMATLKAGVERMLREYVPEVREVVQYN